ncbi:glutathione S-transferase [Zopfochytrium polystomum]|nr:glutathione S-transferase [Zopfochytrium polystomum]
MQTYRKMKWEETLWDDSSNGVDRKKKQPPANMTNTDATPSLTLYSYWRSSASWRVRIVLNHKEIPYTVVPVNLLKDEQLSNEYKAKNPNCTIPSLIYNGTILTQSLAIIEFLEETYTEKSLLPKDPIQRAKVRALVDTIVCDIHPIQNLRVLKMVGDEKKTEWGRHWIERGFIAVEEMLKESAGTYCFGDTVTLADAALAPQVFNARRFGVDMSAFPTISAIDARLATVPAFAAAHPSAQVDAVPA